MNDEIIYSLILFLSIVVGFPLRKLQSIQAKQIATGGVGFLVVFGVCGLDGLYSFIACVVNTIIIKCLRRKTAFVSFIWSFSFLLFFRCVTWFGFHRPSALANAVQLMLTLKLVSVAIEIQDYRSNKRGLVSEPTTMDMFWYSYCYTGLFTGPFFKYRTYHDYLVDDGRTHIPWKKEVFTRLQNIGMFGVLYAIVSFYFKINVPKSDAFYEQPFWFRLFYMVPIFFIGRMRFYSAWLLAECSFVTLTLGAYPTSSKPRPGNGPTQDKEDGDESYSFETIRNIDPYNCDFTSTIRLGMRNWNMGVQWWLANYIHKRWPQNMKHLRVAGVMGVSAFWHGIEPGFYGAFLSMPLFMLAEDQLQKLKVYLPTKLQDSYDWVLWFFKFRAFEYMYMAFALLTWEDTYRYWKSVYFCFHIIAIIIIMTSHLLRSLIRKPRSNEEKLK
ncbi:membrane-bound acylglycerophosphatidylinositol O-acyltransferase mboat7 [Ciona intestinalis]